MDVAVKGRKGERAEKDSPAHAPQGIRKVGIIGAGQMGNGIAHVAALARYDVVLNDVKKEQYEKALAVMQKNMTRQISRGVISEADMQAALKRICYAPNMDALSDCDLVIEAAVEDEAVKRRIFSELCPKLKNT